MVTRLLRGEWLVPSFFFHSFIIDIMRSFLLRNIILHCPFWRLSVDVPLRHPNPVSLRQVLSLDSSMAMEICLAVGEWMPPPDKREKYGNWHLLLSPTFIVFYCSIGIHTAHFPPWWHTEVLYQPWVSTTTCGWMVVTTVRPCLEAICTVHGMDFMDFPRGPDTPPVSLTPVWAFIAMATMWAMEAVLAISTRGLALVVGNRSLQAPPRHSPTVVWVRVHGLCKDCRHRFIARPLPYHNTNTAKTIPISPFTISVLLMHVFYSNKLV